jgi:sarcosine oxidase, subunit gamma
MSEPRIVSPLAGQSAPAGLAVSITEIADRGMIDLRGDPENPSFVAAVEAVLGVSLPRQPRTSVADDELSVLWLSVDQWLVQCPRAEAGDRIGRLKEDLADTPSLVVDMSDARTIIRLEGEGVREIIMKGAPVDLTAPEFHIGTVRRLRFGDVAAMVHMAGEAPDVIDLFVFRSYAVFAWEWLGVTGRGAAQVRLFQPQAAPTA